MTKKTETKQTWAEGTFKILEDLSKDKENIKSGMLESLKKDLGADATNTDFMRGMSAGAELITVLSRDLIEALEPNMETLKFMVKLTSALATIETLKANNNN
jgi:hypothetical protein